MEWPSTSPSPSSVIDRAKEELEVLETNHPNGFHYLKSELQIFISSFESLHNWTYHLPTSPSFPVLTQESSNSKKRKAISKPTSNGDIDEAPPMPKIQKIGSDGECGKKTSKTDMVLKRAQQCIQKIRRFKASL